MKQTPLLFSTPMVQAVLSGIKTMTRRLKGLEEINKNPNSYRAAEFINGLWHFDNKSILWGDPVIKCPYGMPNDILWVKETHFVTDHGHYIFKADSSEETDLPNFFHPKWKPSIFLPKAHSRIWLQITDIKVERLHSITEADIKAEGIKILVSENNKPIFRLGEDNAAITFMPQNFWKDATTATDYHYFFAHWAELWCKLNGRPNWDLNPWVWVIKFERIEKPV